MDSPEGEESECHSNSSDNSDCSETDSDLIEDSQSELGVQPYMFEPYETDAASSSRSSLSSNNNDELPKRMENLEWCKCGNCQIMDRVGECVCCQEVNCVVDKNHEAVDVEGFTDPPSCIVYHPGFSGVCLNYWVLQTAWFQYKQQYQNSYEGPEHKQNRHIAYRQLARWCWGMLGKELRVVLPACAVSCIRAHFPPPGREEDFVFEGFHYADE